MQTIRIIPFLLFSFWAPGVSVFGTEPVLKAWSQRDAVLSLEHVITGIDSLYLRRFDFAFDGGSLLFGFSLKRSSPAEVFVFLPNPKVGGTVDGKQVVVVSNHPHLLRFAFADASDSLLRKFLGLVQNAQFGKPEELNDLESLKKAKEILNSVTKDFSPPSKWGDAALRKKEHANDEFEGDLDGIFK